jgi:hypothetical protein
MHLYYNQEQSDIKKIQEIMKKSDIQANNY